MGSILGLTLKGDPKSGYVLHYKSATLPPLLAGPDGRTNLFNGAMNLHYARVAPPELRDLSRRFPQLESSGISWEGVVPTPTRMDLSFLSIKEADMGVDLPISGWHSALALRSWFITTLKPTVIALARMRYGQKISISLEIFSKEDDGNT